MNVIYSKSSPCIGNKTSNHFREVLNAKYPKESPSSRTAFLLLQLKHSVESENTMQFEHPHQPGLSASGSKELQLNDLLHNERVECFLSTRESAKEAFPF